MFPVFDNIYPEYLFDTILFKLKILYLTRTHDNNEYIVCNKLTYILYTQIFYRNLCYPRTSKTKKKNDYSYD